MQRVVTVGQDFGQKELLDAVNNVRPGEEIVIRPGEYKPGERILSYGVTFRGLGESPADVVLHTGFNVQANAFLKLENLTILNDMEKSNACYVDEGAKLDANSVVFENDSEKNYPTIYLNGGRANLTTCNVRHKKAADTANAAQALYMAKGAHVKLTQCDVGMTQCESSRLESQTTQFHSSLGIDKGSEFSADTLYMAEIYPDYFLLSVEDHSLMKIGSLHLPEGQGLAHLTDSRLVALQSNVDATHLLTVTQKGTSDCDVPGAVLEQAQQANSDAQSDSTSEGDTETADTQDQKDDDHAADKTVQSDEKPAIEQLHEMIGLTSLKKKIDSFVKLAAFNRKRQANGAKVSAQSLHSLFLGNPGTGKTTVARLVAKIMYQNGVMPKNKYVEVTRQDLVSDNVGGTAIQTAKVLKSALGGVLFIDEAYTLYQGGGTTNWGQEAIDTILKYMEDHRDDLMIIFAGYTDKMQDFMNMNPGLTSRAPNVFEFEDYTPEEIAQIGIMNLTAQDYKFDHDYYTKAAIRAFKADVDHSNGRWVRNFNDRLIQIVADRKISDQDQDLDTIENADIDQLTGGNEDQRAAKVDELLKELNGMIGLDSVKKFVTDLVQQIKVDKKLPEQLADADKPTYHMVFAGSPGTGKTTVARIMAKLFYNLDILPKDTVNEVTRADLVGAYIGQTEEKTSTALRNSLGGVLFVDEAYQLTQVGSQNDFGKQAVETFITALENDRDKFVAIFAGYTDQMKDFLAANPGLRSRIPITLTFEDYTPEEVAEIVVAIVTKQWTVNEDLLTRAVITRYRKLPDSERGNGRWARNFAEELINQHRLWLGDHLNDQKLNMQHISDEVVYNSVSWD